VVVLQILSAIALGYSLTGVVYLCRSQADLLLRFLVALTDLLIAWALWPASLYLDSQPIRVALPRSIIPSKQYLRAVADLAAERQKREKWPINR
jgi:hypothetical protein